MSQTAELKALVTLEAATASAFCLNNDLVAALSLQVEWMNQPSVMGENMSSKPAFDALITTARMYRGLGLTEQVSRLRALAQVVRTARL